MRAELTQTGTTVKDTYRFIYIYNFRDYAKLINYLPKENYANLVKRRYNYSAENKPMEKQNRERGSGLSFLPSIRYESLTKMSETWMIENRS